VAGATGGGVDGGADEGVVAARAGRIPPLNLMVKAVPESALRAEKLPAMTTNPAIRVDKWLWAVRLFRTRTAATSACNGGKVTINGAATKPARPVRVGDIIAANNGALTRTVKVLGLLDKRVGAPLVGRYLEDLTPPAEYEAARERAKDTMGRRAPGSGRPTKRDRRILQSFFGTEE
jgi:ribosome-associated heat shock protein Hsp15